MRAVTISALSSGQGKTLFTMALLHWLKNNSAMVRPYKVGPDYIDPQFHQKITGNSSVNLDLYMMNEEEMRNVFAYYAKGMTDLVIEGVMGFYDGMDYGTSTYDIAKTLNVPVILIVSAEGAYNTLIPMIKGIVDYKTDNTVKGIILNKVSSHKHYQTIASQIEKEIPNLKMLGWIQKGLDILSSRHLGLDLNDLNKELDDVSETVMRNIDTDKLLKLMEYQDDLRFDNDFFITISDDIKDKCADLTITVVYDRAFSFVYTQNIDFMEKYFGKVHKISAINDDVIPEDTDIVYIPGGYAETPEVATLLQRAENFKKSLQAVAADNTKKIYAECAGLMFLGEKIQTTDSNWIEGSGILPLSFEINKCRQRLGYYKASDNGNIYKGHAFHYSSPVDAGAIPKWELFKEKTAKPTVGAWTNEKGNVLGTYLHSFFFNQPGMEKYFNLDKQE